MVWFASSDLGSPPRSDDANQIRSGITPLIESGYGPYIPDMVSGRIAVVANHSCFLYKSDQKRIIPDMISGVFKIVLGSDLVCNIRYGKCFGFSKKKEKVLGSRCGLQHRLPKCFELAKNVFAFGQRCFECDFKVFFGLPGSQALVRQENIVRFGVVEFASGDEAQRAILGWCVPVVPAVSPAATASAPMRVYCLIASPKIRYRIAPTVLEL